ncbi:Bifunctional arginine demethylase and lysyl-hydroxylase PSR [Cyberlindnera fabianii]|uniref:Bifunctional arginine demethylase and lysyl-hydroxylase PSR n=1 Tax=Cyberlindnera fabianii TaxID=36022 RepID=A0A1V2L761_CYBFA|nr:Bifunctional arginine demethylase and lysyl-hydroxylase PSR [Cyberlindnera fabianii]
MTVPNQPPYKKRNISRGISRNTVTQRHPLNVKPGGNALIFGDASIDEQRAKSLGVFKDFGDELILDLLSYISDPKDLMNLSHTSRVWYAYLYDEELWRKLYIKLALREEAELGDKAPVPPLGISKWNGSWRRTLLGLPSTKEANITLPDNLLCSDTLFRPYQCSQIDYNELLKDLIDEETESFQLKKTLNTKFGIPRISEEAMTETLFHSTYYNKPFILTTTDANRWPSWSLGTLRSRFKDVKFRQESVQWPLDFYAQYFAENRDESPLYLFDCQSIAMKQLVKEYTVPSIFTKDALQVFNEVSTRPDYRWIIVGPARSGSTFHKDPNATSAWNANLTGKKLWIMLEPGVPPPGVGTDSEESEVTAPVGVAEWVLSGFYNDAVKLALEGKCQIGMTFPGECMYVPAGWWHAVINLEDSVALTQNFVPEPTMGAVLNFLKNKRDQISGFHVNDFKKSLKTFLDKEDVDDNARALFEEWLGKVNDLELDNEDIGECNAAPTLPIYEYFVELLKKSDKYSGVLEQGFKDLEKIERETAKQNQKVVPSAMWDNLIKVDENASIGGVFSFNFDEESDDE